MARPVRGFAAAAALVFAWLLVGCGGDARVAYKELLDEDPQIRADAAMRLGEARAEDAVDSLIAVIDDPDEAVRVSVIRALGQIGDPRAIPAIRTKTNDPLVSVRTAVCQALGWIGDPAGIEPLAEMLYDPNDTIRLVAARSLGEIRDPAAIQTLLDIALRDENEMVRQHVVKVIGSRQAREAIPRVEAALAGEADIVRANAAHVLGLLGDASSVPVLLAALEDPYYKVRSLAAHSLLSIAPDSAEVAAALRDRLAVEDNGMVQVDLAWNLAKAGDRGHMGVIRTLLFEGDPEDVRAEAAIALGEVGDKSDVRLLEKAMNDKKGLVRQKAFLSLQKLKEA